MSSQKFSTFHWEICYEILQFLKTLIVSIFEKSRNKFSIKVYVVTKIIGIQNSNYFNRELDIVKIHIY